MRERYGNRKILNKRTRRRRANERSCSVMRSSISVKEIEWTAASNWCGARKEMM